MRIWTFLGLALFAVTGCATTNAPGEAAAEFDRQQTLREDISSGDIALRNRVDRATRIKSDDDDAGNDPE